MSNKLSFGKTVTMGKYYNTKKYGMLKNIDIIDYLQYQKTNSFDGSIIDPPYNIGKDFGKCKDSLSSNDYVKWSLKYLNELLRVVKTGNLLFMYGFPEILAQIAVEYPIYNQRWLVWHYTNKTVPSAKFWQRSYESILCIWKGKNRPHLASLDELREPYTETFKNNSAGKIRKDTACRYGKSGNITIYNAHPKGALPRDVIKTPALAGGAGKSERWFLCKTCMSVYHPFELNNHRMHVIVKHPTQKPAILSEKLILSITKQNHGNIIIPFVGSGSECVVAKKLGVKFVGTDINTDYLLLATGWLSQTN